MSSTWDSAADAAYIDLRGGNEEVARRQVSAHTEPGAFEVILDISPTGVLLGVEILGAKEALDPSFLSTLERLDF